MEIARIQEMASYDTLAFSFSFTLRGEGINVAEYSSVNYILDINGDFYKRETSSSRAINILVIGGIDRFINDRSSSIGVPFYLTESQKAALYRLLRELSNRTDSAIVSANQERLEMIVASIYQNFIG